MTATLKTTRQGHQVVCGPVTEVRVGQMLVADSPHGGALRTVTVVSLGRPFTADGGQMVYGYLTATPARPAARTATRTARTGRAGYHRYDGCEDCQWIEDAGDGRGCARHRGNPRN